MHYMAFAPSPVIVNTVAPNVGANVHRWGLGGVGGSGGAMSHLASLLPLGAPPLLEPSSPGGGGGCSSSGDVGDFGCSAAESKRLKRLEKNRESARECRRRKKKLKENLEAQLATLEEENLNLRLQLKVGDEAEDAEHSEIKEIKARLDDMVSRGVSEGQILQTMDLLKERYADYGSVHTSAADFHLDQLSRLLLPTLTTRACMHAVLQFDSAAPVSAAPASLCEDAKQRQDVRIPDETVDTPKGSEGTRGESFLAEEAVRERGQGLSSSAEDGSGDCGGAEAAVESPPGRTAGEGKRDGGVVVAIAPVGILTVSDQAGLREDVGAALVDMWSSLVEVLEATEEQQNAMRGQAGAIAELARDLEGTTGILRRLKLLLEDRNQTLDGEMAEIQRILTPTQTAKFVLWVSKNRACVHMLNQLWDKLHGDSSRET
ncbi:unnamed protein product [Ascophyllum nodosum]